MKNGLFNYRDHCFGIANIEKYSQVQAPNMIPETWHSQATALSLWQRERSWLNERFHWSRERLTSWKLQRLSELVDFAFNHVPFYRSIYSAAGFSTGSIRTWNDFESLPLVSKTDMVANFPDGVVPENLKLKECRLIRSSGSSGKPVSVIVDRWRENLDTLHRMAIFEKMGEFSYSPTDWTYNIHHAVWTYSSLLGQYPVFTTSQDCPPTDLIRHLEHLRPVVVSSLASYLVSLAEVGVDMKKIGVKLISSNSETSSLQERLRLESIFKVPVLDEYSSEELGLLAIECKYHRYHAVEDDSHLEILKPANDGLGDVVGTDLWNYAMPFIRYQIGDLASWNSDPMECSCGTGFRSLRAVSGRADQAFLSEVNGKIAPGTLMDACDQFLVPRSSGLAEFRFIQHTLGKLEIIGVPLETNSKLSLENLRGFQSRIEQVFGCKVEILLTYVEAIPNEASYKRRMIINKMRGVK